MVDAGFAERRKTMRNALRRLGVADAEAVLADAGVDPAARAESLSLEDFARIAAGLPGPLDDPAPRAALVTGLGCPRTPS